MKKYIHTILTVLFSFTVVQAAVAEFNPIQISNQDVAPPTVTNINYPNMSGDLVVWQGRGSNGQNSIYLYDFSSDTEKVLVQNEYNQSTPRVSGNLVVYQSQRIYEKPDGSSVLGNGLFVCEYDATATNDICEEVKIADDIIINIQHFVNGGSIVYAAFDESETVPGVYICHYDTVNKECAATDLIMELAVGYTVLDYDNTTGLMALLDAINGKLVLVDIANPNSQYTVVEVDTQTTSILHVDLEGNRIVWDEFYDLMHIKYCEFDLDLSSTCTPTLLQTYNLQNAQDTRAWNPIFNDNMIVYRDGMTPNDAVFYQDISDPSVQQNVQLNNFTWLGTIDANNNRAVWVDFGSAPETANVFTADLEGGSEENDGSNDYAPIVDPAFLSTTMVLGGVPELNRTDGHYHFKATFQVFDESPASVQFDSSMPNPNLTVVKTNFDNEKADFLVHYEPMVPNYQSFFTMKATDENGNMGTGEVWFISENTLACGDYQCQVFENENTCPEDCTDVPPTVDPFYPVSQMVYGPAPDVGRSDDHFHYTTTFFVTDEDPDNVTFDSTDQISGLTIQAQGTSIDYHVFTVHLEPTAPLPYPSETIPFQAFDAAGQIGVGGWTLDTTNLVSCGDDVCQAFENEVICAEDCVNQIPDVTPNVQNSVLEFGPAPEAGISEDHYHFSTTFTVLDDNPDSITFDTSQPVSGVSIHQIQVTEDSAEYFLHYVPTEPSDVDLQIIEVEAFDNAGQRAASIWRVFHSDPVSCGNDICEPFENESICAEDCLDNAPTVNPDYRNPGMVFGPAPVFGRSDDHYHFITSFEVFDEDPDTVTFASSFPHPDLQIVKTSYDSNKADFSVYFEPTAPYYQTQHPLIATDAVGQDSDFAAVALNNINNIACGNGTCDVFENNQLCAEDCDPNYGDNPPIVQPAGQVVYFQNAPAPAFGYNENHYHFIANVSVFDEFPDSVTFGDTVTVSQMSVAKVGYDDDKADFQVHWIPTNPHGSNLATAPTIYYVAEDNFGETDPASITYVMNDVSCDDEICQPWESHQLCPNDCEGPFPGNEPPVVNPETSQSTLEYGPVPEIGRTDDHYHFKTQFTVQDEDPEEIHITQVGFLSGVTVEVFPGSSDYADVLVHWEPQGDVEAQTSREYVAIDIAGEQDRHTATFNMSSLACGDGICQAFENGGAGQCAADCAVPGPENVINGDFESGETVGWSGIKGANKNIVNQNGSNVLELIMANGAKRKVHQTIHGVTGGETYLFSMDMSTLNVSSSAYVIAEWKTGGGATKSETRLGEISGTTSMTPYQTTVTVPTGLNISKVKITVMTEKGTGTAFFDNVSLQKLTLP